MDRAGARRGQALTSLTRRGHLAVALLLAVLTWPVETLRQRANLDTSWRLALHLAAHDGVDWGRAVQFTYGPLGFAGQPLWAFAGTTLVALVVTLAIRAALCATVAWALRDRLGVWWAAAAALVVSFLVRTEAAETFAIVVGLWCLLALGDRLPVRRFTVEAGCALGVVLLLMKFNDGLFTLAAVGVTAFALRPRLVTLARVAGSTLGAFAVLWLATGNPLTAAPTYLRGSWAIASGYAAAMGYDHAPSWEYALAALVGVPLLLAAAAAVGWRPTLRGAAVALVVVLLLFPQFKHSFARHDHSHTPGFFVAAMLVPLGLLRGSARDRAMLGLAVLGAYALVRVNVGQYDVGDLAAAGRLVRQVADVTVPQVRADLDAKAKRVNREVRPVDQSLLDRIGDAPVHVDPYDTSVVWTYGLHWRPVPVFQTYSAYTPYLDDRDAAAVAAPDGPAFVLRRITAPAVDGRVATLDSPAYQLAVVCHFREAARTTAWQLLERTEDRCGQARMIADVTPAPGETVDVPEPADPSSLVVARIDAEAGWSVKLRDLVYKPPPFLVELNGVARRLILANAGQPHLLRASPADPAVPWGGYRTVRTLRFRTSGIGYRVRFYEIPFHGG